MIWKGEAHHYHFGSNRQMPWEREAYRDDRRLADLFDREKDPYEEALAKGDFYAASCPEWSWGESVLE